TDNAIALGTGATAGEAGAVALGSGSVTAAAVGTASGVIGGVTYNFAGTAPSSTVSVSAPGAERTITNVAAGRLGATSTDAVNGSQLFATNLAIEIVSNNVNSVASKWVVGSPVTYVQPASTGTDSTAIGSGAAVNANNSVAMGTGASATTDNSVALGNNAATTAAVATASATIKGTTYNFAGAAPAGVVSVGSAGAERQLQNVAAGQLSATSTDAINGSQYFATTQAINSLATTAGQGINVTTAATGTGVAIGSSVTQVATGTTATYTAGNNMVLTQNGANVAFAVSDSPSLTSVSVQGGPSLSSTEINAGGKTVTDVAPAVSGADAINLNQLNAGIASSTAGLQNNLDRMARKAYAGVASAISMEAAPYVPGKLTYGAGLGYYQSEGAVGLALRRTADNGRWSILGGLSASSGGVGARISFAQVWD
ncbi:MAG: YadA-like family protein, partial [Proteobacteria bacterium]|nr:YadA-like family protein [Pseudomonadota bacterium]